MKPYNYSNDNQWRVLEILDKIGLKPSVLKLDIRTIIREIENEGLESAKDIQLHFIGINENN